MRGVGVRRRLRRRRIGGQIVLLVSLAVSVEVGGRKPRDRGRQYLGIEIWRTPHLPLHPSASLITLNSDDTTPSMPTKEGPGLTKAGIATTSSGERHIPSSLRPDGSVRKEIRVRPGYRPPEDVEVYKNRTAEAWKTRGSGGIPGAEGLQSDSDAAKGNAAANKNAKRREARKKAAATSAETDGQAIQKPADTAEVKEPAEAPVPVDPEVQKEKEAKKLLKKLRQARDLKDKKEKGDALLPEQFEKVIKINELMRQLEGLGFDSNGEKKAVP